MTGKTYLKEIEQPSTSQQGRVDGVDTETDENNANETIEDNVQIKEEEDEEMDGTPGKRSESSKEEQTAKESRLQNKSTGVQVEASKMEDYDSGEETDIEAPEEIAKHQTSDSDDSEIQFKDVYTVESGDRSHDNSRMQNGSHDSDDGEKQDLNDNCVSPNGQATSLEDGDSKSKAVAAETKYIHLCHKEMSELRVLIDYLDSLTEDRRHVPELITDPEELIREGRVCSSDKEMKSIPILCVNECFNAVEVTVG